MQVSASSRFNFLSLSPKRPPYLKAEALHDQSGERVNWRHTVQTHKIQK